MMQEDFDSLHHIAPGVHLYQFYKSIQDYAVMMAGFLGAGLKKGEACLWLVDDSMGLDQVHALASTLIPRFLFYLCSGQLEICSANAWYLREGHFDEEIALIHIKAYIQKMFQKGYTRIRGCGDVAVIPTEERRLLGHYEQQAHELIKNAPVIAVCAYPLAGWSLSETKMVLDVHDHVMVRHP